MERFIFLKCFIDLAQVRSIIVFFGEPGTEKMQQYLVSLDCSWSE